MTAVNSSFPAVDSVFYFYSYFQRKAAGYGTLYETPQISAWCPAIGEYDTYHYDSSQSLGYYTYGLSQKETDEISPAGESTDQVVRGVDKVTGLLEFQRPRYPCQE